MRQSINVHNFKPNAQADNAAMMFAAAKMIGCTCEELEIRQHPTDPNRFATAHDDGCPVIADDNEGEDDAT